MEKNIKVIVAAHKKYQMPNEKMYIPVQVGAEGKKKIEGYIQDNTENNISFKNPYFCELTGLYWTWKNLDSDFIGLVHYRRYFTNDSGVRTGRCRSLEFTGMPAPPIRAPRRDS